MGFVAFLIEERGAKTSGAALSVEEPTAPDEFSRAVDDLVSRKALDDPGNGTDDRSAFRRGRDQ